MTLLTRIWNKSRIILCSDEQVNDAFGQPKPFETTCKTYLLKEINTGIAISGTLNYFDFVLKDYLIDLYKTNKPKNIFEYVKIIENQLIANLPLQWYKEEFLLFISSIHENKILNKILYKCPIKNKLIKSKTIVPNNQYSEKIKSLLVNCYRIDIENTTRKSKHEYMRRVDFNFNYTNLYHSLRNKIHDEEICNKIFYTILRGALKSNGINEAINNLNDQQMILVINNFYNLIYEIPADCSKHLIIDLGFLQIIGYCNAILKIERDRTKSDFIFKDNKCNCDNIISY